MKKSVAFIPTLYRPSMAQLQELSRLQEIIHYSKITALYEVRSKPTHEQVQRLNEFYACLRRQWKVFINEDEDLAEDMNPDQNSPTPL